MVEIFKSLPDGRLFALLQLYMAKKKAPDMSGQSNRVRRKPAAKIARYLNM
jgi:hypothetical protein